MEGVSDQANLCSRGRAGDCFNAIVSGINWAGVGDTLRSNYGSVNCIQIVFLLGISSLEQTRPSAR